MIETGTGRKALRLSINSFFQGTSTSFTFSLMYAFAVDRFGFTSGEVATAMSIGGLTSAVTQLLWGWLVDRATRRRRLLMLIGFLASAISIYLVYNSRSPSDFYLAVATLNTFMGLSNSSWLAILGDLTALEVRGRISGIAQTFTALGTATFSLITGVVMDSLGYWLASLIGVSQFLLAAFTVCLIPGSQHRVFEGTVYRGEHVKGSYRPFLIASILWSFIWSLAWPLFSVAQVKVYGFTKAEIGLIETFTNLTRLMLQPAWGFVADRSGRKVLLVLSPALASAIPFSYAIGSELIHILIGTTVGMVGFSMYYVASMTYLLDSSTHDRRGSAVSKFNAFIYLTNSIAPLAGGAFGDLLGPRRTMLIFGFTRVLSSLFFLKVPETLRKGGK